MTNKGSDLLRKMGWKDGEGLGANASGPPPPPCLSPRRRAGTRPRRDRAAGASCGSPGLTARSRPAVASRAVALALPRGRRQASRRPWRSRSARSARESAPAQRPRFSAPAAPRRRRGLNPRFARGKLNPRFARGKLNARFARGKQVENMVQEGDSLATRNRKKVSPLPPPVPTGRDTPPHARAACRIPPRRDAAARAAAGAAALRVGRAAAGLAPLGRDVGLARAPRRPRRVWGRVLGCRPRARAPPRTGGASAALAPPRMRGALAALAPLTRHATPLSYAKSSDAGRSPARSSGRSWVAH